MIDWLELHRVVVQQLKFMFVQQVGSDISPTPETTLMNMLSLGLEKHLEELTLCSSQASKEYGLENVILHILINSNLFNFYTELSCLNVLALQCSLNDSNSQILQISQAGLSRVNGVRRSSAET